MKKKNKEESWDLELGKDLWDRTQKHMNHKKEKIIINETIKIKNFSFS